MRGLALLFALTACGSTAVKKEPLPGSCEHLIAKSRLVIDDIAMKYVGKTASEDNLEDMIEACNDPGNKERRDSIIACVDAAPDQETIRACWLKDLAPEISELEEDRPPDTRPEVDRSLEKLAKNAKIEWHVHNKFTVGKAGPTPAQPCACGKACPLDEDLWTRDRIWSDLDFIVLEDSRYQYAYTSDGKTFKATATADLDCDGKSAVWVLTGVGDNNGVKTTTTPPPDGVK